ncbi:MAG: glycosyltransferase family 1 protein [Pontixanthobacter sp.]
MPTVCIDCRYIGPRPSGIAEMVQALCDHVPALAPDLDFLLLRHPSRTMPLSNASNVREMPVRWAANGPMGMSALSHVADLSGVNLFHAPSNILPHIAMPAITTVHDILWLTHPRWCNDRPYEQIERRFYNYGIRRALRKSAMIATVSDATRDAILAFDPAIDPRRIVTTRSGVSSDFRTAPDADRANGLPGQAAASPYILIVGQNAPYKNHARAVAAFALAFDDRADMHCIMVQRRGEDGGRLNARIAELGLTDRIHVRSPVPRGELVTLYQGATALFHPSLAEGFGNPLAEAMACGCPVVTSDRSAMVEVTDGAAVLIDPYDVSGMAAALRQVADDDDLTAHLRARGLARGRQLDWGAFAATNIALYRSALRR